MIIIGLKCLFLSCKTSFRFRSVAQPGSASALGAEGRGFESLHSDHFIKPFQSL